MGGWESNTGFTWKHRMGPDYLLKKTHTHHVFSDWVIIHILHVLLIGRAKKRFYGKGKDTLVGMHNYIISNKMLLKKFKNIPKV